MTKLFLFVCVMMGSLSSWAFTVVPAGHQPWYHVSDLNEGQSADYLSASATTLEESTERKCTDVYMALLDQTDFADQVSQLFKSSTRVVSVSFKGIGDESPGAYGLTRVVAFELTLDIEGQEQLGALYLTTQGSLFCDFETIVDEAIAELHI